YHRSRSFAICATVPSQPGVAPEHTYPVAAKYLIPLAHPRSPAHPDSSLLPPSALDASQISWRHMPRICRRRTPGQTPVVGERACGLTPVRPQAADLGASPTVTSQTPGPTRVPLHSRPDFITSAKTRLEVKQRHFVRE